MLILDDADLLLDENKFKLLVIQRYVDLSLEYFVFCIFFRSSFAVTLMFIFFPAKNGIYLFTSKRFHEFTFIFDLYQMFAYFPTFTIFRAVGKLTQFVLCSCHFDEDALEAANGYIQKPYKAFLLTKDDAISTDIIDHYTVNCLSDSSKFDGEYGLTIFL